jgi:hypothetical protein
MWPARLGVVFYLQDEPAVIDFNGLGNIAGLQVPDGLF